MMDRADNLKSRHGFFSRRGGVSKGVYNSLNCGLGSGDEATAVEQNRAIVAREVGGPGSVLFTPYQVHGNICALVDDRVTERPKADALVTRNPELVIGVLTADCCPILFEDRTAGIVGAAHAGWRGATSGITDSTIAMMEALGADKARLRAAIGPTIAQSSYEVGLDMRQEVEESDSSAAAFFEKGRDDAHFQFDLPGYVANRLKNCGVTQVLDLGIDTYRSADHFSYRRMTHEKEPDYGRFVSAIAC